MKSSDTSSTTTPECPPSATPSRSAFALTGRSAALDPRTHAVRPDLADIRLASQVFAPHYAEPMAMVATRDTPIRAGTGAESEVLGTLRSGATFDVLEITSALCWGQERGGAVGYVARTALDRATEQAA